MELTVKAGRRGARDQEERDVGDGGLTKKGWGRGEAGRAVVQMGVERGRVEAEGRELSVGREGSGAGRVVEKGSGRRGEDG